MHLLDDCLFQKCETGLLIFSKVNLHSSNLKSFILSSNIFKILNAEHLTSILIC